LHSYSRLLFHLGNQRKSRQKENSPSQTVGLQPEFFFHRSLKKEPKKSQLQKDSITIQIVVILQRNVSETWSVMLKRGVIFPVNGGFRTPSRDRAGSGHRRIQAEPGGKFAGLQIDY